MKHVRYIFYSVFVWVSVRAYILSTLAILFPIEFSASSPLKLNMGHDHFSEADLISLGFIAAFSTLLLSHIMQPSISLISFEKESTVCCCQFTTAKPPEVTRKCEIIFFLFLGKDKGVC